MLDTMKNGSMGLEAVSDWLKSVLFGSPICDWDFLFFEGEKA